MAAPRSSNSSATGALLMLAAATSGPGSGSTPGPEIGMVEMDFTVPDTLEAGPQIWNVANNGLQVHGENTNDVVSTEAFMMLKEHIIERYGPIRYTMAEGCSGGSYQVMDEAMYPGLIDGLQPPTKVERLADRVAREGLKLRSLAPGANAGSG